MFTLLFLFLLTDVSNTHLVVLLLRQQVVESLVDRLVVVILDRSQVRLHQLQLVHLVNHKQHKSQHIDCVWHSASNPENGAGLAEVDLSVWVPC